MEIIGSSLAAGAFIALYLGLGVWVFAGLMLVGISCLLLMGMPLMQLGAVMKGTIWKSANTWELSAVPIFIWMGDLIYRTDISERLFRGLAPWVDLLPGRLLHTNVLGCTLFAAVSGSSTATTATIGRITTVALSKRGYDNSLAVGSLAGAGSLGLMIPPSITMIVYGVLAETSIARLFAAGLFPGLLAAGFYSTYIALRCTIDPSLVPQTDDSFTNRDRLRGLLNIAPVAVLIPTVLGGIYTGLATPSEAAALGLVATIVLTLILRQLTWKIVVDSLYATVTISAMIISIVVAAGFMSSTISYLHIPQELGAVITGMHLGPYGLMALLGLVYVILGCLLEGLSILVLTLPVTLPLVTQAGWDRIWFGTFLVIVVELATVTPPIGFNLFVLQGLTGQPIGQVARASFPFFLLLLSTAFILAAFPEIALWLPGILYDR